MTTTDELMKLSCVYAAAWTDSDRQATHAYDALRAAIESLVKERDALKAALAEPAAEPVAWLYQNKAGIKAFYMHGDGALLEADKAAAKEFPEAHSMTPLYPAPAAPQAPLTNPQITSILYAQPGNLELDWFYAFARAIERAHGIKESE